MKRKIIGAAAAYMSGSFFASFFTGLTGLIAAFAFGTAFVAAGVRRGFSRADFLMTAVCFVAAFGVNSAYTRLFYEPVVRLDGSVGSFVGEVADFDVYDGDFAVYVLKGRVNGDIPAKIQLLTTELDASFGDVVTVEGGDFSVPVNTYVFPAADYCRARHIFLTAANGDVSVKKTSSGWLREMFSGVRGTVTERFVRELGADVGGFLAGMVFGEKEYLDSATKTALYRSGIGHIMAVSGLHVSIVAAVVMAVFRRLRVNKFIGFGAVSLILAALIGLANCPVSAVRAAVMLEIMYAARLFRQQNDPLNSLAAAALLICLADPYAVWSSGFLLSLSGTFGVAVLGPFMGAKMAKNRIARAFVTAVCTSLAVFPASAVFFDEVSVISPVSNLLLVPLCSFAMMVGLADMVTFGALHLLPAAGFAIRPVIRFSEAAASTGFAHISRSGELVPSVLLVGGAAAAMIFLFSGSRRKTALTIAAAYLLAGGCYAVNGVVRSRMCIVAVVGKAQDAAVIVSCGGRTDIFDLNGGHGTDEYVRKYLASNGLLPDTLVLTKRAESRYSAYLRELEMYAPRDVIRAEKSAEFSGSRQICYRDGAVSVTYGDSVVRIEPYGSGAGGNVLFYGKGGDVPPMNNYEIILTRSGRSILRRL